MESWFRLVLSRATGTRGTRTVGVTAKGTDFTDFADFADFADFTRNAASHSARRDAKRRTARCVLVGRLLECYLIQRRLRPRDARRVRALYGASAPRSQRSRTVGQALVHGWLARYSSQSQLQEEHANSRGGCAAVRIHDDDTSGCPSAPGSQPVPQLGEREHNMNCRQLSSSGPSTHGCIGVQRFASSGELTMSRMMASRRICLVKSAKPQ